MIREAYQQAADFFIRVVEQVPKDRWDTPGLGVWTVRDLVGHASRALTTVEDYQARPADRVDILGPVDYFLRGLETPGAAALIAERGREAGRALGGAPATAVKEIAQRVLLALGQVPDTALLNLPGGGMRLIDYLPTRILELTVHTLDIATAIGLEIQSPQAPMTVTLRLLSDLAVRQGNGPTLALVATGRQALPQGFNLLG